MKKVRVVVLPLYCLFLFNPSDYASNGWQRTVDSILKEAKK